MRRRALGGLLGAGLCGLVVGCGSAPSAVSVFTEQDGRVVLEPRRFGWLSSERETGPLPSAIAVGARNSGRLLLYFEFPELREQRKLLGAQLLLDPTPGRGAGRGGRVPVELSRAAEAGAELRRWSDQPRSLHPRVAGELSAQSLPLRLDVTELLQVRSSRGEPVRLLLRAEPGEGEGVLIATGASGGELPRLELYFQ